MKISIKWTIIWILLHTLSLWLSSLALERLKITGGITYFIFIGLGLTILSNIYKIFTEQRRFVVSLTFVYWLILNTFIIWASKSTLTKFGISGYWAGLFITATLLVILAKISRMVVRGTISRLFIILIIIGILLFYSNQEQSIGFEKQKISEETNTFWETIKETTEKAVNENEEVIKAEKEQESKETLEYVNQKRAQYGRDALMWDDRIYKLAVARSRDMYERDYFDHVTPEGKCAENFKKQFNITEVGNFAENIGGMTYSSDGEPVTGATPKDAVDQWMTSRGHRYALLFFYRDYKRAAVGCYKHICAFLALTKENFVCDTGENGLAYWKKVGKQPGEI